MKIEQYLQEIVSQALMALDLSSDIEIHLEHPAEREHGDYATNIALALYKQQTQFDRPQALAQALVENMTDEQAFIKKIEVAGPGFINFTLSDAFLVAEMVSLIENRAELREPPYLGKKAVVEYMQPNTNKPLHIGHLRNAILGKAMINLLAATGWKVAKATINNDRGLHIVKSMWGYLVSVDQAADQTATSDWRQLLARWQTDPGGWPTPESMEEEKLHKPDYFVGHWYIQADKVAADPHATQAWQEMLLAWEDLNSPDHQSVRQLWKQMNDWFYQGYALSAQKIGFDFDPDHISYESEIYEAGRQIILDGLEKGIFTKLDNGAVQAKLEKFGLPDKILLRGDGTGIYMTFDIELTRQRVKLGADKLVWVVGNDQTLYFQQLFAISELLGFGQRSDFHHFAYGMVRLPEGKMSSRKGWVVYADDVVDLAEEKAGEIIAEKGMLAHLPEVEVTQVAKIVGLGAVKWAMLSMDPLSEVKFDVDKSVSFMGFAGPYLQYTYARSQSILAKVENLDITKPFDLLNDLKAYSQNRPEASLAPAEKELLRNLYIYSEIVATAAAEFAPHHLTTYLFDLAQAFNQFYASHQVLGSGEGAEVEQFRIALVIATSLVIQKGLALLGIEVVAKM